MAEEKKEKKSVTIDTDKFKSGTCKIVDFGEGDKRVVCKEKDKLKIYELAEKEKTEKEK